MVKILDIYDVLAFLLSSKTGQTVSHVQRHALCTRDETAPGSAPRSSGTNAAIADLRSASRRGSVFGCNGSQ